MVFLPKQLPEYAMVFLRKATTGVDDSLFTESDYGGTRRSFYGKHVRGYTTVFLRKVTRGVHDGLFTDLLRKSNKFRTTRKKDPDNLH